MEGQLVAVAFDFERLRLGVVPADFAVAAFHRFRLIPLGGERRKFFRRAAHFTADLQQGAHNDVAEVCAGLQRPQEERRQTGRLDIEPVDVVAELPIERVHLLQHIEHHSTVGTRCRPHWTVQTSHRIRTGTGFHLAAIEVADLRPDDRLAVTRHQAETDRLGTRQGQRRHLIRLDRDIEEPRLLETRGLDIDRQSLERAVRDFHRSAREFGLEQRTAARLHLHLNMSGFDRFSVRPSGIAGEP